MTNIVLGEYKNDKLVYKGHVTLGVGGKPLWRDQQNGQILDTPTRVKALLWHTAYEVIFMAVSRRGAISFGFAHMHSKIYGEKMPSIGVMPGI